MSLQAVIARIAQIDEIVSPRPPAAPATTTGASGFLTALDGVQHSSALAAPAAAPQLGAGTAGQRAIAAAQAEVGVAEQPPGSNDGPRIAEYRTATAGSGVGPWCAYFLSWCASQAGAPPGARAPRRSRRGPESRRPDRVGRAPHRHRGVGRSRRLDPHDRGQLVQ